MYQETTLKVGLEVPVEVVFQEFPKVVTVLIGPEGCRLPVWRVFRKPVPSLNQRSDKGVRRFLRKHGLNSLLAAVN